MKERGLPWIVLAGAALMLAGRAFPSKSAPEEMNFGEFAKVPVAHGGRIKPVDSVARTLLRIISEKETFKDEKGVTQPAVRWLLDVMVDSQDDRTRARKHPVFRIVDLDLLSSLKLERRQYYRYAIDEFADQLPSLADRVQKAREKKQAERPIDRYEKHLLGLVRSLEYYEGVARFALPHFVPPSDGTERWQTVPEAMRASNPNAEGFLPIVRAYAAGNVADFNEAVSAHLAKLGEGRAKDSTKCRLEAYLNRVDAFNLIKWLYVVAFVLAALAWMGWDRPLNRSSFRLLWLLFAVHTTALACRVYLSGKAPVTNLYESAIFIGWACVLLSLILEGVFKMGIGNTIAAIAGFVTLQIADALTADGDTLGVVQAVLDTPFWLWTHVTCITLGYATTYVAGLLGIIYVLRGLLTRSLTADVRAMLARMSYGATCFAMFFSFVGTVLGGLWADDSWGRFWGWDPKENGALMIVLWNALTLHARWGGLVRERGLAVLTLIGNIIVSWSWFGVNELGVGLHSYGFTEGRSLWLGLFSMSQIALVVVGLLPRDLWRSPDAVREPKEKVA